MVGVCPLPPRAEDGAPPLAAERLAGTLLGWSVDADRLAGFFFGWSVDAGRLAGFFAGFADTAALAGFLGCKEGA